MATSEKQDKKAVKRAPLTLKKLREARNITQEEIATRLHTRQASVAKLEKRDNPRFRSIIRVVRAMGGKLVMKVSFPDGMNNELVFAGRPSAKGKVTEAE